MGKKPTYEKDASGLKVDGVSVDKLEENQKQFALFITEVAETMKKHNVENMVCIFGLNGDLRNTYIPLSEKGEVPLYCHISDAFNDWLKQK